MPVPDAAPVPLRVVCHGCGAEGETFDGSDPDSAVVCAPDSGCCQEDHSHAGDGCDRTVTIYPTVALSGEGH